VVIVRGIIGALRALRGHRERGGFAFVAQRGHAREETFYDRVYAFVRAVPRGTVVTYGQVALELGSPAAARAVGYALANLPVTGDVPWWRVINARGGISYRGRGGAVEFQRRKLEAEGIPFRADGTVNLREFRWVTAR
jgi:methylated-DNA-protein-cysteine methyltransferase-like protein